MSLLEAFLEAEMEESDLHSESEVREVWFAIRSDGATGRGTREDPYNGSEVIVYNPPPDYPLFEFDRLLRSVPENSVIHLGPGTFSTGGGNAGGRDRTPWSPKSGQKIVGSGMLQTTLKLVLWNDPDTNQANVIFPAIGIAQTANFSSYEVSDLTIDCNLLGQPNTTDLDYPKITVSGIALYGTNIKVRRVRIINWGRRAATKECFPLYVSERIPGGAYDSGVPQYVAELMSSVVEDCVVEQPDWNIGDDRLNGGGETTAIVAPVVRNCVVRGDLVRPGPFPKIPLLQLSHTYTNPTYTVTMEFPFACQDASAQGTSAHSQGDPLGLFGRHLGNQQRTHLLDHRRGARIFSQSQRPVGGKDPMLTTETPAVGAPESDLSTIRLDWPSHMLGLVGQRTVTVRAVFIHGRARDAGARSS